MSDDELETTKTLEKKQNTEEEPRDGDAGEDADADNDESGKRKRKRKRKKKNNAAPTDDNATTGTGDNAADASIDKLNSNEYTVYLEGIPFVCTEDDVKQFFVSNGCADVLQLRLPTWQDSGRLRGFGHCVFNTTESRNKALKDLNGKHLKNRYLKIEEAKEKSGAGASTGQPRPQPDGCRTIFVKNMPYRGITEKDVEEVFRSCGKIVEGGVRLTRNYQTKELKGFGYVEFKNPEGAFAAVQRGAKGGLLLKGRACRVDYEEGKMKGSFRNADGNLWQKEHGSVYDEQGGEQKRTKRL